MNKKLPAQHTAKSGFTLLELLVVIVIIATLMALILPAIFGVLGNARIVEVSAEMTQLDQALTTFKSKFGQHPPSYLRIPPQGGGWDAKSRAHIKDIWPQFDFASRGGLDSLAPIPPGATLSGAECLVFFLGGMEGGTVASPILSGFSKNPLTPWTLSGSPIGPFMEFDFGRLVDVDEDGLYEYIDTLPGQESPIMYLSGAGSSMDKSNTPEADTSEYANDAYDVFIYTDGPPARDERSRNLGQCYLKPNGQPYKADSFQLISAGEDGVFGVGGVYSENVPAARATERDNITNFSGGTLK